VTLKLLRGVGKSRPLGRRVVCFGGSCGLFAGDSSVSRFFLVFLGALLGFFCGVVFWVLFKFLGFVVGAFCGFLFGFFGSALALLCILPVYVGAPYAFL
jgi:hypothetical protein